MRVPSSLFLSAAFLASLPACALMQQSARTARAEAECQRQESDIDSTSTGRTTTSKVVCEGGQPGQ